MEPYRKGDLKKGNAYLDTSGTYCAQVRCENCKLEEPIWIKKGQMVKESHCPECGCLELSIIE